MTSLRHLPKKKTSKAFNRGVDVAQSDQTYTSKTAGQQKKKKGLLQFLGIKKNDTEEAKPRMWQTQPHLKDSRARFQSAECLSKPPIDEVLFEQQENIKELSTKAAQTEPEYFEDPANQKNPQPSKDMTTQTQPEHLEDLATKEKLPPPKDITTQTESELRDVLTNQNKLQYSKDMGPQTKKPKLEKEELQEPDQRDFIVLQTDKMREFKEHMAYLEASNITDAASNNQESILLQCACKLPIKIDSLSQHLQHTFRRFCKVEIFDYIENYHRGQASHESLENRMTSLVEETLKYLKLDSAYYTTALHDFATQKNPTLAKEKLNHILSKGTSMDILCLIYMTQETFSSEKTVQANQ